MGSDNSAAKNAAKQEKAEEAKLEAERRKRDERLQKQAISSRRAAFSAGSPISPQDTIG